MQLSKEIEQALQFAELRRDTVRDSLSYFYLEYYNALCEELDGTFWAPYSSLRTLEKQQELYNKGRSDSSLRLNESIVTNAKPGDSPHNWGCATDWAEFCPDFRGQDVWNKANWDKFSSAVKKVGLIWGGDFKKLIDKPHCELPLNISWAKIGDTYRVKGIQRAIETIGLNMVRYQKKGI